MKWVCEPWQVNKDQIVTVENFEYSLYENGWVCRGLWLDSVPSTKEYWFTKGEKEVLVRLKHVLTPNIPLDPVSASNPLPRLGNRVREQVCGRDPKTMTVDCHNFFDG